MKVKAKRMFKDTKEKKIRQAGEIFEVNKTRLGKLNTKKRDLVEVLEDDSDGNDGKADGNGKDGNGGKADGNRKDGNDGKSAGDGKDGNDGKSDDDEKSGNDDPSKEDSETKE